MKFAPHFFSSIALSIILFPFFGLSALFAFIGGFMVDIDHYFYFIARKKKLSPRRAWNYFYGRMFMPDRPTMNVFHTVEAFVALLFLSMHSTEILTLTFGFVLHMSLDFADTWYNKFWYDRSNSIVYWLVSHKRIRAQLSGD